MSDEKEIITSAAIQFTLENGQTHLRTGPRHVLIRDDFHADRIRNGWRKIIGESEGFFTSAGRFLDRKQAMGLARENGQLRRPTGRDELNSEDLW